MNEKPSANEKRLAKLLREMDGGDETPPNAWYTSSAAFLARRGVLAVCAKTVPLNMPTQADPPSYYEWPDFRTYLRCLARGAR